MERISILGAGTMGHALAAVFAMGGHPVSLYDINHETLKDAMKRIRTIFEIINESGINDEQLSAADLARVTAHTHLADAVRAAGRVAEAVVEKPEVKQKLYNELASLMAPRTLLASNTSHLNIFDLVPAALQERTLITHWYTPPYIIDLVDIAPGPETLPEHVQKLADLLVRLNKRPLVFKEFIQGYIANRVQAVINAEVTSLLDAGLVSASDVDISIREGLALRMLVLGVLAKADFTDLNLMDSGLRNRAEPVHSTTLADLLEKGHVGIKSGQGFYDWKQADIDELARERDLRMLEIKKSLAKAPIMLGK